MKSLLLKLAVFLLLLSAVVLLPLTVLILGREYATSEEILATQKANPSALAGFFYNGQSFVPYKEALIASRTPKIIALGTSRVMQFREIFFKDETIFANAGGGAKNLYDIKRFVEGLPPSVAVVIVGLDEDMFTGEVDAPSYDKRNEAPTMRGLLFGNLRKIYVDLAHKKIPLAQLIEKRKGGSLGLAAIFSGDGFREDGSYRYGHVINAENKEAVRNEMDSIADNLKIGRYSAFEKTGGEEKNLLLLDDILHLAKEKNIEVIGFIPPYPHLLLSEMQKTPGFKETVVELPKAMEGVFAKEGFSLFDFSEVSAYGGNEEEFVDSIHASDKSYARMLLVMAKQSSSLRPYVDRDALLHMIQKEKRDLFTF